MLTVHLAKMQVQEGGQGNSQAPLSLIRPLGIPGAEHKALHILPASRRQPHVALPAQEPRNLRARAQALCDLSKKNSSIEKGKGGLGVFAVFFAVF